MTTKTKTKPVKAIKGATSRSTRTTRSTSKADRTYDAIVIGGGHNGLTNGAYLAKAGLRVLILERRHLVGGAAITEELRPGFWFTTFSYALSLLRPQIIHDLELTKHGFMPLLMSSTFAPMEDGDYLWLGQDHGANLKEIARHSKRDADAYEQYGFDMNKVCQAIKPIFDMVPPDIFSDDPEELMGLAKVGGILRSMDKRTLHNFVRLMTGSAADFLDDYFESDIVKGYLASSSIIGTKVGPQSQGSGLVLLFHSMGEHDGEFGAWAFHKGGNGGFTKVLARAAEAFGAEIRLEQPVANVITRHGRATGVALTDGTEFYADTVVSSLDPRRTFLELVEPRELPDDLVESIERFRFQGTSSKVNFALDGLPEYPALPGRGDIFRGFTNIGPSIDYLERAFDEGKYGWYSSRPYIDGAIQSTIDADMAPPASTSCRASSTTRRTTCARATGMPSARTWATPSSARWSPSSRASPTWSSSARSRPRSISSARSGCPRATSSRASSSRRRCSSSGRRPAGRSTGRRSTATTSAARARIRVAA